MKTVEPDLFDVACQLFDIAHDICFPELHLYAQHLLDIYYEKV